MTGKHDRNDFFVPVSQIKLVDMNVTELARIPSTDNEGSAFNKMLKEIQCRRREKLHTEPSKISDEDDKPKDKIEKDQDHEDIDRESKESNTADDKKESRKLYIGPTEKFRTLTNRALLFRLIKPMPAIEADEEDPIKDDIEDIASKNCGDKHNEHKSQKLTIANLYMEQKILVAHGYHERRTPMEKLPEQLASMLQRLLPRFLYEEDFIKKERDINLQSLNDAFKALNWGPCYGNDASVTHFLTLLAQATQFINIPMASLQKNIRSIIQNKYFSLNQKNARADKGIIAFILCLLTEIYFEKINYDLLKKTEKGLVKSEEIHRFPKARHISADQEQSIIAAVIMYKKLVNEIEKNPNSQNTNNLEKFLNHMAVGDRATNLISTLGKLS